MDFDEGGKRLNPVRLGGYHASRNGRRERVDRVLIGDLRDVAIATIEKRRAAHKRRAVTRPQNSVAAAGLRKSCLNELCGGS